MIRSEAESGGLRKQERGRQAQLRLCKICDLHMRRYFAMPFTLQDSIQTILNDPNVGKRLDSFFPLELV